MEKIKINFEINDDDLKNLELVITAFENFIKKVNPKDLDTILEISPKHLEAVFAIFQDTDLSRSIENYDNMTFGLIECIKTHAEQIKKQKGTIITDQYESTFKLLETVYEAAKESLPVFQKDYKTLIDDKTLIERIHTLIDKKKFIDLELLLEARKLCDRRTEFSGLSLYLSLVGLNLELLKTKKEEVKPLYSEKQLKDMKRNRYIETYNLEISEDITLEVLEEVILEARVLGLSFIQSHPEIFKEKKKQFLVNLNLLKNVIPDLKIVVERDPEAFLIENLYQNLKLISAYEIDLSELLYYRKKALTDLSYFNTLDLMIESGDIYLDLKMLLDINNKELKKRIVLRLLGISDLKLKEDLPLDKDEINLFLEKRSTVLKNGMNLFEHCILDDFYQTGRYYLINGIRISRPKVLRNIESEDDITIDSICCNSFFTSEEMNSLTKTINELKESYQFKKRQN